LDDLESAEELDIIAVTDAQHELDELREDLEPGTIIFSDKSESDAAAFFRDLCKVGTIGACASCHTGKKGCKEVSFLVLVPFFR